MKPQADERLKSWRVRQGPFASTDAFGNTGAFVIPGPLGFKLQVISSEGALGWEHISVTTFRKNRTPTWDEMAFIKSVFWGDEETVIEYHPPKSEYVNTHEHVLHLWRPVGIEIPLPPASLVGIKPKRQRLNAPA
jgi:hypothetical protein